VDIGSLTGQVSLEDQLSDKMELMVHHVKEFAENFDSMTKGVVIGASAIAAAITGAVISIVELGEKGSVIEGVEHAFDHLAEAAGTTGDALRGGLMEGVKGTVDDLKLMESTSRLLSSGMKLTADQAKLMGSAARELGKATGGDATSGLAMLSSALVTGRVRSLQQQIGLIDLKKAELDFAAAHGKTVDQLSASGQLEAKRIGILQATAAYVERLGVSELSFKERIQQAEVAVDEWWDSLEKGIATSPHISAAMDAIGKAITTTFGGEGQQALDIILDGVNHFADAVTKFAPPIISALGNIKDGFIAAGRELVNLNTRFDITKNITDGAIEVWHVLHDAVLLVGQGAKILADAWSAIPQIFRDWIEVAAGARAAFVLVSAALYGMIPGTIGAEFAALGTALGLVATEAEVVGEEMVVTSTLVGGVVSYFTNLGAALVFASNELGITALATKSMAAGQVFLAGIMATTNEALVLFSEELGITSAAEYVTTTASSVLAAAKSFLGSIVLAVTVNYNALIVRLGLSTAAMAVSTVGAQAATAAMTALGVALLAVQYVLLPVAVAWGAWKFGEWLGGFQSVQRAMIWLAEKLHIISHDTADARREFLGLKDDLDTVGDGKGFVPLTEDVAKFRSEMTKIGIDSGKTGKDLEDFVNNAVSKLHTLKDNGASSVRDLNLELDALIKGHTSAEGPFKRIAEEARQLQTSGAQLTPALAALVDRFDAVGKSAGAAGEGFFKDGKLADEFKAKVTALVTKFTEGDIETRAFTQAFGTLGEATRNNVAAQQLLAPEIEKLTNAHQQLSPAMEDVYQKSILSKQALIAQDEATLSAQGVTLALIDSEKEAGLTEQNIATIRGVSVEGLKAQEAALKRVHDAQQELTKLQNTAATARNQNTLSGPQLEKSNLADQERDQLAQLQDLFNTTNLSVEAMQQRWTAIEATYAEKRMGIEIKAAEGSLAGDDARLKALVDYSEKSFQLTLNSTGREIRQLDVENIHAIANLGIRTEANKVMWDKAADEIDSYFEHERLVSLKTSDTVAERMLRAGVEDKAVWEQRRADAIEYYNFATQHSNLYTTQQILNLKKIVVASDQDTIAMQQDWTDALGTIEQAFANLASVAAGSFASILKGASGIAGGLKTASQVKNKDNSQGVAGIASPFWDSDATAADKWAAGIASATQIASGAMAAWTASANAGSKAAAAFDGALAGAQAGAAFGAWGALIGGAAGLIEGFIHSLTAGRRSVEDFAKSFDTVAAGDGFTELHNKLLLLPDNIGEQFWIRLTQQIRRGDKAGAKAVEDEITAALAQYDKDVASTPSAMADASGYKTAAQLQETADKAKQTYDYMVASGKYTADVLKTAFDAWQTAAIAAGDQSVIAIKKAQDGIAALDSQIKGLQDSYANEAPEAVMGDVEKAARAQVDALKKQREDAQKQLEEASKTAADSAAQSAEQSSMRSEESWTKAGHRVDEALRDLFAKGYDSDLRIHSHTTGDSGVSAEPHAGGGFVGQTAPYQPSGSTDKVLTNLTPGELILTSAEQTAVASKIATPAVSTSAIEQAIVDGFSHASQAIARVRTPVLDTAPKVLLNNPTADVTSAIDQRPNVRQTTAIEQAIVNGFSQASSAITRMRTPVLDFAPKILLNNQTPVFDQSPKVIAGATTTNVSNVSNVSHVNNVLPFAGPRTVEKSPTLVDDADARIKRFGKTLTETAAFIAAGSPGQGSKAGAFIQNPDGGWVPRDHPSAVVPPVPLDVSPQEHQIKVLDDFGTKAAALTAAQQKDFAGWIAARDYAAEKRMTALYNNTADGTMPTSTAQGALFAKLDGALSVANAALMSFRTQRPSDQSQLAALISERDHITDVRLDAMFSGRADDAVDKMGTPSGKLMRELDDALTGANKRLKDFTSATTEVTSAAFKAAGSPGEGSKAGAFIQNPDGGWVPRDHPSAIRRIAFDVPTVEPKVVERSPNIDIIDPYVDVNKRVKNFGDTLLGATTNLLAFKAAGSPGAGSKAGAFVQLLNGQWVPQDHPLAMSKISAPHRIPFEQPTIPPHPASPPMRLAQGGEVQGEEGIDRIPALLTRGEHVDTVAETRSVQENKTATQVIHVHNDVAVSFAGATFKDKVDAEAFAIALARTLEEGGAPRSILGRQIVSIVRQAEKKAS
jgi:hypothetical protein